MFGRVVCSVTIDHIDNNTTIGDLKMIYIDRVYPQYAGNRSLIDRVQLLSFRDVNYTDNTKSLQEYGIVDGESISIRCNFK